MPRSHARSDIAKFATYEPIEDHDFTNDGSRKGIAHMLRPWLSVHFRPEACCSPIDTAFLFDESGDLPRGLCSPIDTAFLSSTTTGTLSGVPSAIPHHAHMQASATALTRAGFGVGRSHPRSGGQVRLTRQPGHQSAPGSHQSQHRDIAGLQGLGFMRPLVSMVVEKTTRKVLDRSPAIVRVQGGGAFVHGTA